MSDALLEEPVVMDCNGDRLMGILAVPEVCKGHPVLIVVGGPQYRVGSHRQFVLLARALARAGIPSLRFDYRGMGDSEGGLHSFEAVAEDIRIALDVLTARVPQTLGVVIWGLCDAASAAVMYACDDHRVAGLVLLNPWVRTSEGEARALLKYYYAKRLVDGDFWRKVLHGDLNWRHALRGAAANVGQAMESKTAVVEAASTSSALHNRAATGESLPDRMASALMHFRGKVLIILSGNDLTAQEFRDVTARSRQWQSQLADHRVAKREIGEANHTFATRQWRDLVARWTAEWVLALELEKC